jgi:hypothetical protein
LLDSSSESTSSFIGRIFGEVRNDSITDDSYFDELQATSSEEDRTYSFFEENPFQI